MNAEETKRGKAKNLRYKKAIVKELNIDFIQEELWEITGACDDVRYYFESDDDTLLNALDGDEDETFEFKMMFADLCAECEQMSEDLQNEYIPECFDDFFTAAGAGRVAGGLLGWDSYEQDYFGIDSYSCDEAQKESQKRIKRMTKDEIIECMGACTRVLYSYIGLRSRYDSLKAAMDILRDQNTGYLQVVKEIEETYREADKDCFRPWGESTKKLERLLESMPQEAWIQ